MSNPRIYQQQSFAIGDTITLSEDAFGHTIRVLRLKSGDNLTLFNGELNQGVLGDYQAEITDVSKKNAQVIIKSFTEKNVESPLNIHLGQGISRGDRMDFTLQKSVELGVNTITPLFTERCGVKLTGERLQKKIDQWQKIVVSACEQSGRCSVPIVMPAVYLDEWLTQPSTSLKLNLHPKAQYSIMNLPEKNISDSNQRVRLLIGPEGGLSEDEIKRANEASFVDVLLGPRILRTETAALTAITALQCRFGDIN
ncbi:16S rRNA (uracil(1498)-N(3))-methyltransferase [Colwellia hornerae]|uniref:Ribosomal RNA small subunit methyltransferase E n=1 Tax=Colwellia hornerae TaxID=89402 RepID=A0A5C6Q386_9GAMM|nr:16S rRNA (uracil(1498)-N(3))-methyltransferase [Colwellia hornerae]TWX46567.1 16S rRNA (uracil(1498)-N(3))-methyltransferase [Colwellia hornerae]TWX54315.1 16S rRNA (uracil(1498)-N(3))-methyltransferase [Colwellia hornerae]TWX63117.1 16S rRNA (uracil(1498)-N(3))-methyltransferase [Colwellia hornerae]